MEGRRGRLRSVRVSEGGMLHGRRARKNGVCSESSPTSSVDQTSSSQIHAYVTPSPSASSVHYRDRPPPLHPSSVRVVCDSTGLHSANDRPTTEYLRCHPVRVPLRISARDTSQHPRVRMHIDPIPSPASSP